MEYRLYKAALIGDVASLDGLLEQGNLLLDTASFDGETPLHIASQCGHFEFAEKILYLRPTFASKLDFARRSPLHLASMKDHIEIVKLLLRIDPSMCLARDQDGMTPLHVAALKGRVEVVKELMHVDKIASQVLSNKREPILHMCVNHDRFNVVEALLECVHDDDEFVKMKDDDDNTILHVAVAKKHIQLTKLLLQKTMLSEEINAPNIHHLTALDVLLQNHNKSSNDMELERVLLRNKAKASAMPPPTVGWMSSKSDDMEEGVTPPEDTRKKIPIDGWMSSKSDDMEEGVTPPEDTGNKLRIDCCMSSKRDDSVEGVAPGEDTGKKLRIDGCMSSKGDEIEKRVAPREDTWTEHYEWLKDVKSELMIVAILITTVTYQAGVAPPGGVWQDDQHGHVAGESVLATKYPVTFSLFTIFNSIGFFSSLVVILLLIGRFPLNEGILTLALTIITWMALSSMIITYFHALSTTCTSDVFKRTGLAYALSIAGWLLIVSLLFTGHIVGLVIRLYSVLLDMYGR